eukprot:CAMPEP_0185024596 /NCGR_PEP_ID=MMETSP1103-20130426/7733_1 /TAXON_ID=36769 /ORGANISM="Paraphysomonas bandaiensis, Strain Caron Lab Isolate" /LENGTH=252 /DNA_ID=CAMNT_0027557611 /DNA_START=122 /DNA_END=880 /DNA_ORIENTATION=+
MSSQPLLRLDNLVPNPGAFKARKRVGRGMGGRGKTSGHGHQCSRVTPRGFEGGQTPLYKLVPKIGFTNPNARRMVILNLDKVQDFIDMGRLVPKENQLLTLRDLYVAGLINKVDDGVKLLSKGKSKLKAKIHFEVSMASSGAIKAVEDAGGTVTCVHLNKLALRALIKPYKFELLPGRARPNPKIMPYYLDRTKCGYLSPEVQIRNLKLFGYVTSEELLQEEHANYMKAKRKLGLLSFQQPQSGSELLEEIE